MFNKFLLIIIFSFFSCDTAQKNVSQVEGQIDFIAEGYTKVETVTTKNTAACTTLFKTEKGEVLEFSNYDKVIDGLASGYWIKFNRQRKLPKCRNAQPVEVVAIQAIND